jgi:hypothetical protein
MSSLGTELPKEIARVRDEVLPLYLEIGQPGMFGAAAIRQTLDEASQAMISGDVIAMIRVYEELKGING